MVAIGVTGHRILTELDRINAGVDEALRSAIPIIIGVTGHRDLRTEDTPELEQQVRKIFEELQVQYPDTPLLVLSPLAEGADRLVARVALEQHTQLVVPLPLPRLEYEKDFNTPESRAKFDRLLEKAWKCFELPLVVGNTLENIQNYGPNRDKQYAQVGAYIARHSQILIALWDGVETGLVGGTAQIVKFQLEGIPEPYAPSHNPLDIVDNGPVYHIVTPRVKNSPPAGEPFSLHIKFPTGWETADPLDSYTRILDRMNTFNRDVKRLSPKLEESIKKNKERVIPEAKTPSLSETARAILDQYAVADTLAIYFQGWRRRTLVTLFTIAVLAVLSFEVYAHLLGKPWVLAIYPTSLGLAFLLYFLAQRQDFQNKHLDYRVLAEGLRVQLFWNLAGLPDEVAEHYLRQHRTELEWIRNAIRAWNVSAVQTGVVANPAGATMAVQGSAKSLKELVLEHWVKDQRKFFNNATDRDRRKLERHTQLAERLFVFGLALAIVVIMLHSKFHESSVYSHWHHLLIVIMGIAPAIAAAVGGYAEKMAFSAQAKRYEWMSALFTRAHKQLKALLNQNKLSEAKQLIRELGKEALEENGDWVIVHRERTPEVHIRG